MTMSRVATNVNAARCIFIETCTIVIECRQSPMFKLATRCPKSRIATEWACSIGSDTQVQLLAQTYCCLIWLFSLERAIETYNCGAQLVKWLFALAFARFRKTCIIWRDWWLIINFVRLFGAQSIDGVSLIALNYDDRDWRWISIFVKRLILIILIILSRNFAPTRRLVLKQNLNQDTRICVCVSSSLLIRLVVSQSYLYVCLLYGNFFQS